MTMGISTSISRVSEYYGRHGLWATIRRAGLAVKRALFSSRMVLFYCDLSRLTAPLVDLPSFLKVERKTNAAEITPEDLQEMTSFWNPKLVERNVKERFDKGASLWLIRWKGRLAGYMWTLQGCTVEPHYFPLGQDDVHFFDLFVFPKFRVWAVPWSLQAHVRHRLAAEGLARAFTEAPEWNRPSLAFLKMTPFRRLGMARKFTVFGRTVVWRGGDQATGQDLVPITVGITDRFSRFVAYYRRNGIGASIRRAGLAARRGLFSGRSVLFYCDLSRLTAPPADLPSFLKVERKTNAAEITPEDLQEMTSFWNPKLVQRNMKERFGNGASLWLIKFHHRLAGYGWTLQGTTIEPYYFPLGPEDVQFLDFLVFPKFRGRAIDWFLMTQVLHRLAAEGLARALGEAREWNQASLASFRMSPFRCLGLAKELRVFGHTLVCWAKHGSVWRSTKVPVPAASRAIDNPTIGQ